MFSFNLILRKGHSSATKPPKKTATRPIELPLDTNVRSPIKSDRSIRIQKIAHWVKSWWGPVEREPRQMSLSMQTTSKQSTQTQYDSTRYRETCRSQHIWKPSATQKESCKSQQIWHQSENQVSKKNQSQTILGYNPNFNMVLESPPKFVETSAIRYKLSDNPPFISAHQTQLCCTWVC
jgi:hypothetical protein